jgi:hypothetical protein
MNLDELKAAVSAKFKPFVLEVSADVKAEFAQYYLLPAEARAALTAAEAEMLRISQDKDSTPAQDEAALRTAIEGAFRTAGTGNVEGVLSALGGDIATLLTAWEEYRKGTSGNN